MDALVPALSLACATAFSSLGAGYGLLMLGLLGALGLNVKSLVGVVLASQAAASLSTAVVARRLGASLSGCAETALAAMAAFIAAASLGVALPDKARLAVVAALLALSVPATLASSRPTVMSPGRFTHLAVGCAAGALKAVVGGGLTPALYLLQRLAGYGFSAAVVRAVASEALVCAAAAAPYLALGVDSALLAASSAAAAVGSALGVLVSSGAPEGPRRVLAALLYAAVALLLAARLPH